MTRPAYTVRRAIYPGEEIRAGFTQTFDHDEFGRGDIECEWIEICGKRVEYARLPEEVKELISALPDECEWE